MYGGTHTKPTKSIYIVIYHPYYWNDQRHQLLLRNIHESILNKNMLFIVSFYYNDYFLRFVSRVLIYRESNPFLPFCRKSLSRREYSLQPTCKCHCVAGETHVYFCIQVTRICIQTAQRTIYIHIRVYVSSWFLSQLNTSICAHWSLLRMRAIRTSYTISFKSTVIGLMFTQILWSFNGRAFFFFSWVRMFPYWCVCTHWKWKSNIQKK